MQTKIENVRGEASLKILWKWTGVSALLHGVMIASLCGVSYLGFHQREAATKAKAAAEEAAAKKVESDEAAKNAAAATPTPAAAPATQAAAATPPPAEAAPDAANKQQAQAEKILGIDKTAKPEEMPNSPFSSKGDDLLKDLK